jgi:LysM repeat protein
MNNPNPLVPQGSLMEQKNNGRARVKIAVFVVLAIHGIGLFALLMQGCNKPPSTDLQTQEIHTNPPPTFVENTNPPPVDTNPPVASTPVPSPSNAPSTYTPPAYTPPAAPEPQPPVAAAPLAAAGEYKVAKGDMLVTIARKNHISLKALQDANPGLDAKKLKVGQTLHIPAPAASTPSAPAANPVASPAPDEQRGASQVYTVKSGDTLSKIASQHGVTIKALRAANSLKTDRIVVGQKLKLPEKKVASSAPASASTAPVPSEPSATPLPTSATTPGR